MPRWTVDIFRQIRPHHFAMTFKNPRRAIRELKYRYTFSSKTHFGGKILSLSKKVVCDLLNELHENSFFKTLDRQIELHHISEGRGPMGDEVELLYLGVRSVKPSLVVETGVGSGFSTTLILEALKQNDHGELYSIDFFNEDEKCGWIIPDNLKMRWNLIRGLSGEVLNPLLRDLGPIDIFIHDSDHSYENMISEFRTAWNHLRKGGIFFAHDVGRNEALFDFCDEVNFPWWRVRTYKVLGGLRKI